ncbi:MAG: MOSC domain-containing protein [Jatrophihabitans sp.]
MTGPFVAVVHRDAGHRFSKPTVAEIVLRAGLGVEGDSHFGSTVQHRSRMRRDPTAPNLRQVHLLQAEMVDELIARGFDVSPGSVGENVTTRGVDLLALPTGTQLRLGADALVEITGLRNPCVQLDRFAGGLMAATLDRDAAGSLVRRAGVMAVVRNDGAVRAGDLVQTEPPDGPHRPLEPV